MNTKYQKKYTLCLATNFGVVAGTLLFMFYNVTYCGEIKFDFSALASKHMGVSAGTNTSTE